MNTASRAPVPPPIQMPSRTATSPVNTTPQSADSSRYSSDYYTDMMAAASPSNNQRKGSGSSQKHVNANSYCGRHSDQYLFGGHSIGELWRNITKKE